MSLPKPSWHPPLLISTTIFLHCAGLALLIGHFDLWPWILAGLLANHFVLMCVGLWPRSQAMGSNLLRLPDPQQRVAITIDDGPDPAVTPQVLEILDAHGARASFFCVGAKVRAHPALAREIVARGHRIENHSEHHLHRFSALGPKAMAREVQSAQDSITQTTGQRPRYFRAPAGLRNIFLDRILYQRDLQLASWTRRGFDTRDRDAERVLRRLTRNLAEGDILLLHDGNAAPGPDGQPLILYLLPRLLARIAQKGLRATTLP